MFSVTEYQYQLINTHHHRGIFNQFIIDLINLGGEGDVEYGGDGEWLLLFLDKHWNSIV